MKFATEFDAAYRVGPQVGRGAHVEERLNALWNFGPMIRFGDRNSIGLLGHISHTGPDNPRAGAMVRVRRAISPRSSMELAAGMTFYESGWHGGKPTSTILMADWCYRDLLLPTIMVQIPPSDEKMDTAPLVLLGAKSGSKAGLLLGTLVPIAAFMVVGLALSS